MCNRVYPCHRCDDRHDFKIHPFLSILLVSTVLGIIGGIPVTDIAGVIGNGFSGTFTSIGIVIIYSTSLVAFITEQADVLQSIGIFFPFLLAAILKSAQGSSTVAITTTAGIMAPLMAPLGMDSTIMSVLCVMAIGAGAMTVSHANDSYFWVVTNLAV
ncbi:MAG: hypothetical protein J6K75_03510 [Erysipelotrichaceae bacterium]|nr:hypothetical protein [Erysipelotrichaceae bacterium]